MARWWCGVAAVAIAWTAGAADPAGPIWSGSSGGVTVTWSTDDVTARRSGPDGELVFAARAEAERAWRRATADEKRPCSEDRGVEVLSLVGPLLSLAISADGFCTGAAHPYASRRWATVDLSRVDQGRPAPVRLTALAPEADVLRALLQDPVVRAALAGRTGPPPASLAELFAAADEHPITVGECTFELTDAGLTGFAIHHLAGNDRMAVRLGLPYREEACRGQIAQLGLELPIAERLRAELAQAAGRRAGFLQQDLKTIAGGRRAAFHLTAGPAPH